MAMSDAEHVYAECCRNTGIPHDPAAFHPFLQSLAPPLIDLDFDIVQKRRESNGVMTLFFVNRVEDTWSKLGSVFSASDIMYYRRILDEMATQANWRLEVMEVIKLRPSSMSLKEVEVVLETLVEYGWLRLHSDDNEYTVGDRAVVELGQVMHATYEDSLDECHACRQMMLDGEACNACPVRLHGYCARTLFQRAHHVDTNRNETCPGCREPWTRAQMGQGTRRRRQQQRRTSDDENDQDMD